MHIVVASDRGANRSVMGADRFNLHADPGAIERIAAAREHAPLRSFLANVNASGSVFATFACKIWSSTEGGGAESKIFASYIDVIFLQESTNFGCGPHEDLARRLSQLLEREPGEALRGELRISPVAFAADDDGFCLRIILYARGETLEQARVRWGLGLARVQQALLFVARELRQEHGAAGAEQEIP
jgi:hypothetical protein